MRQAKIVATIGPASEGKRVLPRLLKAGVNVVRLNFSHGSYAEMRRIIRDVRQWSDQHNQPVGIMQDLQGSRIRLGMLPPRGIALKRGEMVSLVKEDQVSRASGEATILPTKESLDRLVKTGEPILINDGLIRLRVVQVGGGQVLAEVEQGDVVTSHRGINLPRSTMPTSVLTAKDWRDLKFGLAQQVDWLALSFVRTSQDVRTLKRLLPRRGAYRPKVIAKIERQEAVRNFNSILAEADGIMIARGDLGIEIEAEEVPFIQKQFVRQAMSAGKPVIVATQMLESMTANPRPTRAEVSDVANAILDGTDAVMLSGETANGQYPVEAVKTMVKVISQTEASQFRFTGQSEGDGAPGHSGHQTSPALLAHTAAQVVRSGQVEAVVVMSASGTSAGLIAAERPPVPIIALTQNQTARRQMALYWSVTPQFLRRYTALDTLIQATVKLLKQNGSVKKGNRVLIACGHPTGPHGHLNLLKIQTIR